MSLCLSTLNSQVARFIGKAQYRAKAWATALLLGAVWGLISSPAQARGPVDRFADLPITVETPAFSSAKRDSTSRSMKMAQFIARLDLQTEHLIWRILGKTAGGREMHLLLFTSDGKSNAFEIAASRKPVVWIIGQQHGDEPQALKRVWRLHGAWLWEILKECWIVSQW